MVVIRFALLLALGGCAYSVHQYHVGETEPFRKHKQVSAEAKQFTFLGFVTNTDYVNQAYAKLQRSCSTGRITGIHTRYTTDLGFFSWTNRIKMTGVCVQ